eukprot:CAMPEP_0172549288 /NCGR_PEP_ID=MMETSP1067-20121228/18417_1 /TAXON_ID=265564 ORGANISM="Thalassiosira punctigera, Strain Tpunct2005C2" /NCGR_SAMPLE_ID=MMETSP1067 /ASSEMBLY_ACC=CAM_ASM_000444 /LENGTH=96 /DNA_ID=CAMNT_0013336651 /DNA_START=188 /DNA_END=478 /DNA_ORIENTATION=-
MTPVSGTSTSSSSEAIVVSLDTSGPFLAEAKDVSLDASRPFPAAPASSSSALNASLSSSTSIMVGPANDSESGFASSGGREYTCVTSATSPTSPPS